MANLKIGKFSCADAGQMRCTSTTPASAGQSPVKTRLSALILCAEKGAVEVHYVLDNRLNKILAAEYQTVMPDEKLIAEELERSRRELDHQRLSAQ